MELEINPKVVKSIGIFGGSFNPPTIFHVQMLKQLLTKKMVDEVWIVPSGTRWDKKIDTSGQHRLSMLQIAINDLIPQNLKQKIKILEVEVHGYFVPTHTLMKNLQLLYPNFQFFFVMGGDNLK